MTVLFNIASHKASPARRLFMPWAFVAAGLLGGCGGGSSTSTDPSGTTELSAAAMLGVSYYWFLRARTTIDADGIRQTWLYDKQVLWSEVRGAKMIGIPYAGWLFPPRMIVRTGSAFTTFNGGSQEGLIEFAKISLAFQMKK